MVDESNPSESQYAVFFVKEKDPDRPIEPRMMQILSYRRFGDWIENEKKDHVIQNNYDSEIEEWPRDQLATTP